MSDPEIVFKITEAGWVPVRYTQHHHIHQYNEAGLPKGRLHPAVGPPTQKTGLYRRSTAPEGGRLMELKKYPDRSTTVDKLQQLHDEVDGNVSVTFRGREIRAESSLNILRIEVLDPAANGVPEDLIAVADMFAGQLRSNDITTRDGDSPERVLDAAKHHIDSNQ